ncbi:YopX family protein [Fusobacterium gastrosuis]|uniref:YopX family protein n=1 Tax=Fusobacterium gastrosuis TaxID=1755100 RepID=UPI0029746183|nr:YopX family protein [Fusobacteriaceae bacterium]MDY3359134.1 YopX family protein [Clostridium celatum]MDY5713843.1 YopX family protein [Fusobacterium gastrosuis]
MREIIFRAWDRFKQRWSNYKINDGTVYFMDKNTGVWYGSYNKRYKDFNLMQYTGLKDRNGKEIYEGDILLSTTEYGVFLISIGFGYSEKDNDILGAFKLKIEKQLALSQYFEDFDDNLIKLVNKYNIPIEENNIKCINDGWWIVGNIYENPELLGDDEE